MQTLVMATIQSKDPLYLKTYPKPLAVYAQREQVQKGVNE